MARTSSKSKSNIDPASPLAGFINRVTSAKQDVSSHVVEIDESILTSSRPHLPSGSFVIDALISGPPRENGVHVCPGWPRGTICRLYGKEGSGKTTLALVSAASTCARGGTVLYIDFEQEVDIPYAYSLGVPVTDPGKFMLMRPDTLEEGIRYMIAAAESGIDLIIVDSVGAGVPQAIMDRSLEEDATQDRLGRLAASWSAALPKIKVKLSRSNSAVIGICQLRAAVDMKSTRGPSYTIQGGNAWAFYNSLSMYLRPGFKTKSKEQNALKNTVETSVVGFEVVARLDKCKVSRQAFKEQTFFLRSGEGIDDVTSIINMLSDYKLIKRSGSWYSWEPPGEDEVRAQGMENFRAMVMEDANLMNLMKMQALPLLGKEAVSKEAAEMFDNTDLSPEQMEELIRKEASGAEDLEFIDDE